MFLSFSNKNHAESFRNFIKKTFLDPKRAKLDQNSDFRHVRTYMDPYGPMDRSWQVRTFPISDFWSNFACFGFKNEFLTKFLNDSAWFCVEKLKKQGFETQKL